MAIGSIQLISVFAVQAPTGFNLVIIELVSPLYSVSNDVTYGSMLVVCPLQDVLTRPALVR